MRNFTTLYMYCTPKSTLFIIMTISSTWWMAGVECIPLILNESIHLEVVAEQQHREKYYKTSKATKWKCSTCLKEAQMGRVCRVEEVQEISKPCRN